MSVTRQVGRLPDALIAYVGGGSNAIGTFCPFLDDNVAMHGVEAAGFGISLPSHVRQVIDNGANAAIIGSAFSKIVEQNLRDSDKMLKMLPQRAQTLKRETHLS